MFRVGKVLVAHLLFATFMFGWLNATDSKWTTRQGRGSAKELRGTVEVKGTRSERLEELEKPKRLERLGAPDYAFLEKVDFTKIEKKGSSLDIYLLHLNKLACIAYYGETPEAKQTARQTLERLARQTGNIPAKQLFGLLLIAEGKTEDAKEYLLAIEKEGVYVKLGLDMLKRADAAQHAQMVLRCFRCATD
jgi:hypothetical protein